MPSFSRLYHHYRGTGPAAKTTPKIFKPRDGLATFGSSENKKKSGKDGNGTNSMAKYMGTRGTGMTTLGTQGGFEEETLELRGHSTSTANVDRAATPETFTRMDDMENGGHRSVSGEEAAQNHIWKTSQVRQTYSRLSDPDWNRKAGQDVHTMELRL
jgi:hypothetical protein